jgi:wyosine [tRNA(Phe)-imidazoG37] synthetase (radical SAM superfamily)
MKIINKSTQHYCSQKFWWLSVYPEKKLTASCCAAETQPIDLTWLKNNPGRLFNTPKLQEERQQMLDGVRVKSCETECWKAEDSGLTSRRLSMQSNILNESSIESTPTVLNILLGSDCNLTCVYCCKQFSTAWYRDVKNNGPYFDNDGRFEITLIDKTLDALGQNKIKTSDSFQQILDECKQFKNVDTIVISGGEPFLYNGLPELVNSLSGNIKVVTGLGVDNARLERMLGQITNNVTLILSAEGTGKYYELARFGNTFKKWQENLETIRRLQIPHTFLSVISNLTIFDFQNFQKQFEDQGINIQVCTDPDYLAVNVLDNTSREKFLDSDFGKFTADIHTSLKVIPTIDQQEKFSHYIKSFVSRRNISLDIYPESFTNWANLT